VVISTVLDHFNLRKEFEFVCSGEDEQFGKPHPAIYMTTIARLQVHSTECLAFEDSLNGVIASRAALTNVVAVPAEAFRNDARFSIAHLVLPALDHFTEAQLDSFDHLR